LCFFLTCFFFFQVQVREKAQNFRRLEAQRNELNAKGFRIALHLLVIFHIIIFFLFHSICAVRRLREELAELQEPGSYVGEVVKAMGKNKVLVKVCHTGNSCELFEQQQLTQYRSIPKANTSWISTRP
jgi:26S proteasome regulatory subunit T6